MKSDDELDMVLLCRDLKLQQKDYTTARIGKISATRAIEIYWQLMKDTNLQIKELERRGIKKVEISDAEIETLVQQQIIKQVN